jgi:anti-sigma regulatory factor (Ser/Thr protein kinase)
LRQSVSFAIVDQNQVGEMRRFAQRIVTEELGFDETEAGKVSIVVTELATNLVKHADRGEMILRTVSQGKVRGLEVLALDKGPGMANPAECMHNGYSTAGSPGTGLGAIQRLSSHFEINSVPTLGTAIMTTHWPGPLLRGAEPFEVGAVSIPVEGERICGDGWAAEVKNVHPLFLVADGLGHGPAAAEAAEEAIRIFEASPNLSPSEILLETHNALWKTRGAAEAIAQLYPEGGEIHFSGIGNINAAVISSEFTSQNMVSHNGTLGAQIHRLKEFSYRWEKNSILVMHSDGLTAKWNLNRYPGLLTKHPSLIAGVLYRDYRRGNDDATVLVFREATTR